MKIKAKKKIAIVSAILALMGLFVGVGFYTSDLTTASAATYTTAKCLTRGRTKTGDKTTVGCPENFKIYMYGSATSGTKTLYQNDLLDWTMYNITVEPSKVSNHLTFDLYRNGYLYKNKTLSGNDNQTLYSGTLSDGEYELKYTCQYRPNIFVGYTKFEYSYKFEVDKTAPVGELKAGGYYVSSGGYTNKQFEYSATDKNLSHIRVLSPGSSSYSYYYGDTYTVAASNANNGWWHFFAQDYLNASSSTVSICLDTVAPVGTVKDSAGIKIANGGYTNRAVSYTASDNLGVYRYEVKKPNDTSWQNYTAGTSLSSYLGWYSFRATDYANNVSEEYKVYFDPVAPIGSLYAGNTYVTNGVYTNASYVKYTAVDSNSGIANCYVRMPNGSTYTSYAGGTQLATEGTYSFYSVDRSGNTSATVSITLDKTKPVGTLYGGTSVKADGSYTNAAYVKYTASDSISGIANCYVKKPNSSSYTIYTSGTQLTTEGKYYFYCIDRSGNTSATVSITLDRTNPTGTLYGGTDTKQSGSYTNASYVAYTASDSISGIANCYVKMPNSSYFTSYTSGTQLATEGTYNFYSVDRSGNASATVSITLDKTKPTGTLYGGTSSISSGSSTNAQYIKFVPYDAIGLSATYVKKPGSGSYVSYTSGTQLTAEGTYSFYSVDRAGSISQYYTVTLDRHIPAAQLYVDDKPIGNNGYTNGAHIKFVCNEKCYVKQPGSTAFQEYVSGTEYYKPGKYVFYGISTAGTSSGNYTIVIDRMVKTLTVNNVKNGCTDGDVTLTWTDGDKDVYAPIKTVTINSKTYNKGVTVHTIATGNYRVEVTDAAGNQWQTSFSSTKQNIVTETLQKEYFEAFDADGAYYAFASYDRALAFAQKRESGYVTTGEWNSANWDTGMAMDAKDSVNAVNGRYFVYKKAGNPEERVAYFTEERLNEVITAYAKQGIEDYFYWEKAPATIADGENLFAYSDGTKILASSVQLGSHIGCLLDGKAFADGVVETEGEHLLTVKDDWGNSREYLLTVIRRVPDIEYAVGEGNANIAAFDRTYYFKDQVTLSVAEEYDEMAMFNVYDVDGVLLGNFSRGETFVITESGKYKAEAVNHFGKTETFAFIVSRSAPQIQVTENAEKKRLEICITASTDDEAHIATLEILKSTDGGETWAAVSSDDYGKTVSTETLSYTFCTSGIYKVVVTDEFRTGIDAITVTHNYAQPRPEGVLKGVNENGYTNGTVSFAWTDEVTVMLVKDGVQIDYVSGQKLTEDGVYALTFENRDGYEEKHEFVIDTKAPVIILEGVENGGEVSGDVTAVLEENDLSVELYLNGRAQRSYLSGTTITECGNYRIVATDRALNQTEVSFTIRKTVDYSINVNEKGLSNAVTVTAHEDVTVELTKDGEIVQYTIGEEITAPGVYFLALTDKLGNRAENTFTIVEPIVKAFEYNFDDMPEFERVEIGGEERRLNYGTLELKEDGEYEVGVVVGGQTYFFTVTVDSTAPVLTIEGVENGGTTKSAVRLSELSETAEVRVYLNGQEVKYNLGEEFTEKGQYHVTVTDASGNCSEYTFEIVGGMSGGWIALIVIGCLVLVGGAVTVVILKKKNVL